jgi:hypothetical protein
MVYQHPRVPVKIPVLAAVCRTLSRPVQTGKQISAIGWITNFQLPTVDYNLIRTYEKLVKLWGNSFDRTLKFKHNAVFPIGFGNGQMDHSLMALHPEGPLKTRLKRNAVRVFGLCACRVGSNCLRSSQRLKKFRHQTCARCQLLWSLGAQFLPVMLKSARRLAISLPTMISCPLINHLSVFLPVLVPLLTLDHRGRIIALILRPE